MFKTRTTNAVSVVLFFVALGLAPVELVEQFNIPGGSRGMVVLGTGIVQATIIVILYGMNWRLLRPKK
jgi:hypothetical protein